MFPAIPRFRQMHRARKDATNPIQATYAKGGEDRRILEMLNACGLKAYTYIDVGANHPTTQSNTYLFYRNGISGIAIEPNIEYKRMFKQFRPADDFIPVGCGAKPDLKSYQKFTCSSVNSFAGADQEPSVIQHAQIVETSFIPVMPLDLIWDRSSRRSQQIGLLSIDAEGMDLEILEGATTLFPNTWVICIEVNVTVRERVVAYLKDFGFTFQEQIRGNLLFLKRHATCS